MSRYRYQSQPTSERKYGHSHISLYRIKNDRPRNQEVRIDGATHVKNVNIAQAKTRIKLQENIQPSHFISRKPLIPFNPFCCIQLSMKAGQPVPQQTFEQIKSKPELQNSLLKSRHQRHYQSQQIFDTEKLNSLPQSQLDKIMRPQILKSDS